MPTLSDMSGPGSTQPSTLQIGLQEWAVCCQAALSGQLMLMVRKGGIHEAHGGLFALDHARFALMPTYLHQHASRLREGFLARGPQDPFVDPHPGTIAISGWAEALRIWKVDDLERLQALGSELAWSAEELALRFRYRQPGVHVVALRVWRLPQIQLREDHASYAGCRSWVTLRMSIPLDGSVRVLDEGMEQRRLAGIARTLDLER